MVLHAGAGAGAGAGGGPKVVLPIVAPHLHLPRTGGEVTPPPPPPPPPPTPSSTLHTNSALSKRDICIIVLYY